MLESTENFRHGMQLGIKSVSALGDEFMALCGALEGDDQVTRLMAFELAAMNNQVATAALLVQFERQAKRLAAEIAECRLLLVKRAMEHERELRAQLGGEE